MHQNSYNDKTGLTDDPTTIPFELDDFWNSTSTDGARPLGDPMTLTWGFVADGTPITQAFGGDTGNPSNLIAYLDGVFGNGGGGNDYTTRPWFTYFESVLEVWSNLTGITYVYVTYDDGATINGSSATWGQLNVRPDVRFSGHRIDGNSNVLAYNYFPNAGDMVLDTDDNFYANNSANNYRGLRNVLSHEHGHGIGLGHVNSNNVNILMEPFINLTFDGPREDDILGGNRGYGDASEPNESSAAATNLGTIGDGANTTMDSVNIDDESDMDFFSFTITNTATATITLTPIGSTYSVGPDGGGQSNFNALAQSNLSIQLIATNGSTIITSANNTGAGSNEVITNQDLADGAGTYFVKVSGNTNDVVQRYELTVAITHTGCPDNLVISDNTVAAGTYEAVNDLSTMDNTTVVVPSGNTVVFKAGASITLNKGFSTSPTGINSFTAKIESCAAALFTDTAPTTLKSTTETSNPSASSITKNELAISPNPLQNTASISFSLSAESRIDMGLYNASGQLMQVLIDGVPHQKGYYEYELDASELYGGLFYLFMRTQSGIITKKLIVKKEK